MKLVLDVENTVTNRNGKMHLDPFEPTNSLVMVGMLTEDNREIQVVFDHAKEPNTLNGTNLVQNTLNNTTLLIGHNIAYDLVWLWESGFTYTGSVFDTMLGEYVLQRGIKQSLKLQDCAERYMLDTKKQDTLKEYFSKGYTTRDIPFGELSEYLSCDLHATKQLYDKICNRLVQQDGVPLIDTIKLTNELCPVIAKIYQRGFAVDTNALNKVQQEFEQEQIQLQKDLSNIVKDLMGDTPINLNSPEQLSTVIYSRKPQDKATWSSKFAPNMHTADFKKEVSINSQVVYKTVAKQCSNCKGKGYYTKTKKDGNPYSKPSRCSSCDTQGYHFIPTDRQAGLRFNAPKSKWISAHGFSTSKVNLEVLEKAAKQKGLKIAEEFLYKVRRLSAVDTYLSSFVEGIKTHQKPDGKLHVRLLQHRTSTGRLSGADPNMQNMPRGGTFPVKRVFKSQWDNGKILEADFAQLEFRAAAFLSQDKIAMKEIEDGFDVHAYTAKVISDNGQVTTRQEGKAHTFAPLYGATGFGRTAAEAAYYEQFTKKYKGIALWHSRLAKEALTTGKITTPSGRQFAFPDVERRLRGGISHFTQIKNYPVQSFATADIVPVALLYIEKRLKDMKSCIVNTVHDSIVIDIHPQEEDQVIYIIDATNNVLDSLIENKWNIVFNVPLALEAKIGKNWLDTVDVL
tara:strand:- start:5273 stop:7315 length:2043 start_codon:yes stop_codon:yes gene_type:complete